MSYIRHDKDNVEKPTQPSSNSITVLDNCEGWTPITYEVWNGDYVAKNFDNTVRTAGTFQARNFDNTVRTPVAYQRHDINNVPVDSCLPPPPPEPENGNVVGLTLSAGLYKKKYEGYFYDQDSFFNTRLVSTFDFTDSTGNDFYEITNVGGAGVTQQDWADWGFLPMSQYDSPNAIPLPFPSVGKGVMYIGASPNPISGSASVIRSTVSEEVTSVIDDSYSQAAGQNNKSLIIKGYFKPTVTGVYKFRLYSDDASYLWLGSNAFDGNRTTNNSVVLLPGIHGPYYSEEGIFTMTANLYYPLTVEFGNGPEGEGVLIFEYQPPNSETWTSDLTGKLFHDVNAKGHVNQ
jgi:hypothetical protein